MPAGDFGLPFRNRQTEAGATCAPCFVALLERFENPLLHGG